MQNRCDKSGHHAQVLQNLTQQLLAEKAEKNEFKEMLEQEGIELQSVIADRDQLQKRMQELVERVWSTKLPKILLFPSHFAR